VSTACEVQELSDLLKACFVRYDVSGVGYLRASRLPRFLKDILAWPSFRPLAAIHGAFVDSAADEMWQSLQSMPTATEVALFEVACDIEGRGTVPLQRLRSVLKQLAAVQEADDVQPLLIKVASHVLEVRPLGVQIRCSGHIIAERRPSQALVAGVQSGIEL
jgi:hypothetical protein